MPARLPASFARPVPALCQDWRPKEVSMLRRWLLDVVLPFSSHFGYAGGQAVKQLGESRHWTVEQTAAHQGRALCALTHHCYQQVPYYQALMLAVPLRPE